MSSVTWLRESVAAISFGAAIGFGVGVVFHYSYRNEAFRPPSGTVVTDETVAKEDTQLKTVMEAKEKSDMIEAARVENAARVEDLIYETAELLVKEKKHDVSLEQSALNAEVKQRKPSFKFDVLERKSSFTDQEKIESVLQSMQSSLSTLTTPTSPTSPTTRPSPALLSGMAKFIQERFSL